MTTKPEPADAASREQAAKSAAHWRSLAASERDMASHLESLKLVAPSHHARAESYDRTAACLELEAETGQPHCSYCLGPHPNHLHGHFQS